MCWSFDDQSLCEWKIFDFCTSINVSAAWLGQSHRHFCFSMFNPISDLMPFTNINQRLKGYQMRSMYAHCIERRLGLIPGCQSYSKSTPTLKKNTNISRSEKQASPVILEVIVPRAKAEYFPLNWALSGWAIGTETIGRTWYVRNFNLIRWVR